MTRARMRGKEAGIDRESAQVDIKEGDIIIFSVGQVIR